MKQTLEINELLDFYGPLLTESQGSVMAMYYRLDYSLNEIADNLDISKQAVSSNIHRATTSLRKFEEVLGLAQARREEAGRLKEVRSSLEKISQASQDPLIQEEVGKLRKLIDREEGFYGI